MTVLHAEGISVRYGGVRALTDVDLEVRSGQLVGLIGPNGAGKTTFIDAVTGFAPCEGRILLGGKDLTSAPAHVRAQRGLIRTWQSIELFDDLTVRENLAVAADRESGWAAFRETWRRPRLSPSLDDILALLDLQTAAEAMPADLSHGVRKLVGVARALAARPQLVCLDEPAAGLDTKDSGELGEKLRSLAGDGASMLLVDHDMGLVLGVCDYVYVLNFGRLIAQGTPEAVRTDPQVIEAYLGSATEATAPMRSSHG